jgi:hypothetical protein
MKRYKIIKTVFLDFLTPQDQITRKYNNGEGFVEYNETNTAWYISPSGERKETINYGWVIQKYIDDGLLKEIKHEKEDNIECPNCGEKENFHFNYDYSKKEMSVVDILCNECGKFFELKEINHG